MKRIFSLVIALLVALMPLAAAAEPLPTGTANATPPAPEGTFFEPSERQSTNMTPALCANENDTGDLSLSDVRVGCNGNGEYFSDSV